MGTGEGDDGIETSRESEATEDTDMTFLWRLLHPQGTAQVSLELIPGAGRGLVASQDLEPGEVVLVDEVNFQIHLHRLVKLIITTTGAHHSALRAKSSLGMQRVPVDRSLFPVQVSPCLLQPDLQSSLAF